MDNNKPIINSIDVSECEFYNNYECEAYRHEYWEPQDNTKDMCKWHENCYFKQLKRLQEELDFMIGSGEILEKLQKENEELKKYQYTQEYLQSEIGKRQKALEEIREIIEFRFKTAYMTFGLKETNKIIEDIEKIANEVFNDRD